MISQLTLFGDGIPTASSRVLPDRIRDMHTIFGDTPGRTCAQCVHLQRYRQGGTWYKCLKTDYTAGSVSTDWRTGWPACGLFEQRQTEHNTGANER